MTIEKPIYLQKIKQDNMSVILQQIWEHEGISRVELVTLTKLTSGTVTNLTQELIQLGLIREFATSSSAIGRKRVKLKYNTDQFMIIGIDISRTSYELILTDLAGQVINSVEGNTIGIHQPEKILDLIAPLIQNMITYASSKGMPVIGLGVSIPGPIDRKSGQLLTPPNFPGWENFPITSTLEKRFGLRVFIEDDARASALAERWYGLGRNVQNSLFITMGMGIGGGVISRGELVEGANGLYGQVGHITLIPNGLLCACGNRGCWETVGSIPGILRRWSVGDSIDDFFHAVHQEDPHAVQCLKDTLSDLESALTTLFNTYDPEIIVLGGRLYPYLAMYMDDIRSHVKDRIYSFVRDRLRIENATFGSSQNAKGAVALVFERLLTAPLQMLTTDNAKEK
ncbi:ROK family transcriptional regulator [Cohnella abietis]|uniref:Xylose repressor n=1 Tax=Cohnella abietis TaxID=2507935 RepID=A0A3T1DBR8_9BACL|nr:ROK family transcriptional regulator [Cohnella abietis]BBI35395.1 xylose repressor [Cohnella abietis]